MTSKKKISVDTLLTQLEKRELEEALGSYTKTQMGNAQTPFAKEQARLKNTPQKPIDVSSGGPGMLRPGRIPAWVANKVQNTSDPYAKEKIVPHLFNIDIIKAAGSLTPEQQEAMRQHAIASHQALRTTNWTQIFFNTMLRGASSTVKLTTLLENPSILNSSTDFYTNYNISIFSPLFEAESVGVVAGARDRSIVFLNSNKEIRAYIRAARSTSLYIGAASSGHYINFTQNFMSLPSEEALKVKSFGDSIFQQVSQKVFGEIEQHFRTPQEKEFFKTLTSEALPNVVKDAFIFGLVDTLNLPLSPSYGTQHQAGNKLATSPLITNTGEYGDSLSASNPEAASVISEKLHACLNHSNPFVIDMQKLMQANSRVRTKQTFWNSLTTVIFGNFGNILSKLDKVVGSKFDFAPIMTQPDINNKVALTKQAYKQGHIFRDIDADNKVPNPFVKITFNHTQETRSAYVIRPMVVSGITFKKTDILKKNDRTILASFTGEKAESNSKEWKGLGIPDQQHEYLLSIAARNPDGKTVSTKAYLDALLSLETRSGTSQNELAGATTTSTESLLHVIGSLYNDGEGTFKPDCVLFALVPRLLFQGAELGMLSSCDEPLYGRALKDLLSISVSDEPENVQERTAIIQNLRPLSEMLDEFLTATYDLNSTASDIVALKGRFKLLIKNIQAGYWFLESSNTDIGVADYLEKNQQLGLVNILKASSSGEIEFDTDVLHFNIYEQLRRELIKYYPKLVKGTT